MKISKCFWAFLLIVLLSQVCLALNYGPIRFRILKGDTAELVEGAKIDVEEANRYSPTVYNKLATLYTSRLRSTTISVDLAYLGFEQYGKQRIVVQKSGYKTVTKNWGDWDGELRMRDGKFDTLIRIYPIVLSTPMRNITR